MIEAVKVHTARSRRYHNTIITSNAHRLSRRGPSGQAIVEGTLALWLLVTAFVLMIAFGLNLFFITQWTAKVALVANQAAKVVAVNRYWLGMTRPDYKESDTQARAKTVANTLCKQLGLPNPTVTFSTSSDDSGDYNKVVVTVPSLPLPFQLKNVFPSVFDVTGTGIDFEPRQQIYAAMNIACVKPPLDHTGTKGRINAVAIPVYGFYSADSPSYQGESNQQPSSLGGGISGDYQPKFFRGLPLTNAYLNSVNAPPEFDKGFLADGTQTIFDGDGQQP